MSDTLTTEEVMALLRKTPLVVFDPDTKTLKNVTGVCQNGTAIQLSTEAWKVRVQKKHKR